MPTTIAVSPLGRQDASTDEVIQLDVFASEMEFLGVYDRLEIWRSGGSDSGPYSEMTAASSLAARIPATGGDTPAVPVTGASYNLVGSDLSFLVNESQAVQVLFTGVDPLTATALAAQIVAQGLGLLGSYVDELGQIVVETASVGTGARLRVLGGTAAGALGLPVEVVPARGRDARLGLLPGQTRYLFTDLYGSALSAYKIRFRNAYNLAVSEFSLPHRVGAREGVSRSSLILGTLDMVQVNGRPLINHSVLVHTLFNGSLVDSMLMAGSGVTAFTDENGHVEFTLVRGQKVSVSIPGTSLIRTITVPTDPALQSFNLWDPSVGSQDVFKVQVPDLIVAERRTL